MSNIDKDDFTPTVVTGFAAAKIVEQSHQHSNVTDVEVGHTALLAAISLPRGVEDEHLSVAIYNAFN